MDFETYGRFGLNAPFENKDREKFGSGNFNINAELTREEQKQARLLRLARIAEAERRTYPLPKEAEVQAGTPQGRLIPYRKWSQSTVYPGTERDWWIYIPEQYDGSQPANLLLFNDGRSARSNQGGRVTIILDNLIASGDIPPTIAVFLQPGIRPGHPDCAYDPAGPHLAVHDDTQRSYEYDSMTELYTQFLLVDVLPVVESRCQVSQDPGRRCIAGMSSGAVAAFLAAWYRPDKFGCVISAVGSYVNIRGAHNLHWSVRNTPRKPFRVFIQSGEHDNDNAHGNWPLANKTMAQALEYAGYDHRFEFGTGGHSDRHITSLLPEALRWLYGQGTLQAKI